MTLRALAKFSSFVIESYRQCHRHENEIQHTVATACSFTAIRGLAHRECLENSALARTLEIARRDGSTRDSQNSASHILQRQSKILPLRWQSLLRRLFQSSKPSE